MNKKLLLTAMIAAALIFGILAIGCDDDSDDGVAKSIKITGLTEYNGKEGEIDLQTTKVDGNEIASGLDTVADGSLTVALFNKSMTPWTGAGAFFIDLDIWDGGNQTEYISKAKVDISGPITEIPFSQFKLDD
jgi:hypothetical protein